MRDKIVVITGASAGIGAALARVLAERGASIVLVARREDKLEEVARAIGSRTHRIVADVSRRDEVRRIVSESLARFGRIDVWVNNVGQGISRVPSLLTDEDIDELVRINVKSALYGMQEVLPHFKERGEGHVINVSSMLGRVPFVVLRSAYSGAKHFLNALTANFRDEVKQTHPGIQFSLVSPGVGRHRIRSERAPRRPGLPPAPQRAESRGRRHGHRERHRDATARRLHARRRARDGRHVLRNRRRGPLSWGWTRVRFPPPQPARSHNSAMLEPGQGTDRRSWGILGGRFSSEVPFFGPKSPARGEKDR